MLQDLELRNQVKTTQFCIIAMCILTVVLWFQVLVTQREVRKTAISVDNTSAALMKNRRILQDFIDKSSVNTKSLP